MARHRPWFLLVAAATLAITLASACVTAPSPTAAPLKEEASQMEAPTSAPATATNPNMAMADTSTSMQTAPPPAVRAEPVAYLAEGQIALAKSDGTLVRLIAQGVWAGPPVWSPDRSRVAYAVVYPPEAKGTYVARADGSAAPVKIAPIAVLDSPPSWSPDGQRLALREKAGVGQGLWLVNTDGTGLTLLFGKDNISDMAWSPDGATVAFSLNPSPTSGGVYLMSPGGGEPQLVTPLLRAGALAWSPDGKHIAVRSEAAEGTRVLSKVKGTGRLNVITVASGEMVQVASGLSKGPWRPAWANPHTIAVVLEGGDNQALAVVTGTGEAMAVLVRGPEFRDVTWTSDGSALLASVTTPNGTFLVRVTLQGIGMDWSMDMDMTRNMKVERIEVLKNGAFQEWPAKLLEMSGGAIASPPEATGALRMARLVFDKWS